MGEIDGGEILVRMLKAEGVDCVFTLHGGHLRSNPGSYPKAGYLVLSFGLWHLDLIGIW